ncbi:hypothetical protein Q3G72_005736 [Acer saccharum]|nr:hypothetical protein Q3G72_005736 [Acer saccharum]
MAFAAILRKSDPSLAWLARVNRNHHSAIFTASSNLSWSSFVPIFRLSSAVESKKKSSYDESLIQLIDSEIKCAVEERDRSEWVPSGFPFKIEDIPGQQTIILTREYQDEVVKVEVSMPDLDPGEEIEYDEDFNYDSRRKVEPSEAIIPLVVTVTKNSGTSLKVQILSFRKSETSKDEMPYGPDFRDLDENLKNALCWYLEIRGIEPTTTHLMFEMILNKDNNEYLLWSKSVKNFIEA